MAQRKEDPCERDHETFHQGGNKFRKGNPSGYRAQNKMSGFKRKAATT